MESNRAIREEGGNHGRHRTIIGLQKQWVMTILAFLSIFISRSSISQTYDDIVSLERAMLENESSSSAAAASAVVVVDENAVKDDENVSMDRNNVEHGMDTYVLNGTGWKTNNNNNHSVVTFNPIRLVVQTHGAVNETDMDTNGTETTTTTTTSAIRNGITPTTTMSFCLLMKDDNDILPEWISYHYHLWNLRTLIVAVDPSAVTSPASILNSWKDHFGLHVTLWTDTDYMPIDFLENGHIEGKAEMPKIAKRAGISNVTEIKRIQAHRYRQREFYRKCIERLSINSTATDSSSVKFEVSWIGHIDTDEYLTINPWLTSRHGIETPQWIHDLQPTVGSMMQVLEEHQRPGCFVLPRLLFGSIEDNPTSAIDSSESLIKSNETSMDAMWDRTRFESLRWKYHTNWMDELRNGLPKALLDWRVIKTDEWEGRRKQLLKSVDSIHRPLRQEACPPSVRFDQTDDVPIAIHHYLGSEERFLSRDDTRRTKEVRKKQSVGIHDPICHVCDTDVFAYFTFQFYTFLVDLRHEGSELLSWSGCDAT